MVLLQDKALPIQITMIIPETPLILYFALATYMTPPTQRRFHDILIDGSSFVQLLRVR